MLSALRKAGQVKLGSLTLSTNASLIHQNEFATLLSEKVPNVRIIDSTFILPGDTREKSVQYQQERIPGARFFDIDFVADKSTNLPHMLPSLTEWSEHMKKFNIGVNDSVICYDDFSIIGASRAWWTLKVFGVKNCWVLNSNFAKWKSEGLPTEQGQPSALNSASVRPAEDFNFSFNQNLVKGIRDIKRWMNASNKDYELVDARSPGRFTGVDPDPRGLKSGHIPGSKNLFFKNLLDENMCFKNEVEIAKIIEASGINLNKDIWFTCGSGVTASVLYTAFFQVGLQKTSVYDGSWSEWAADKANPVGVASTMQ